MKFQKIVLAVGVVVGVFSCSTKKNSFIHRNWHALNTQYNVLYNGTVAFEQGRAELNSGYRDDYWELLPVERLEVTEEIKLDSEGNTPDFMLAEEKATKAIQKHSMDIRGRERNPKTDEAFLLLGKARYFDQRYIPALEAFNYIIDKYNKSDKLNEARIWRAKTNMRLNHWELAIKSLNRLLHWGKLEDQEYADAHAVLAQCYVYLNAPDTALQKLNVARVCTQKKPEKGRYGFIMGQLYDQLGYKDSANAVYDDVIALKRKSPRVYRVHAQLQKIRNTAVTEETKTALGEDLSALEKDRENRPFLDKIYSAIAQFHLATQADSLALVYYNKSLRSTQGDSKLNAFNYQSLADYYFNQRAYKTAGRYYDSTLTQLSEPDKLYRRIRKKLDHLEEVIVYETLVQEVDSILTLYYKSDAERRVYVEAYIAELKEQDAVAADPEQPVPGVVSRAETRMAGENRGAFYFYNPTGVAYGKTVFKTRWGDRELKDDWRWSYTVDGLAAEAAGGVVAREAALPKFKEAEKYSPDFYLKQIPTEPSVIDSLQAEKNFANYQLGLIYKEKFKDDKRAAAKLESVLASNPEERLVLPCKYNLYKIYEGTRDSLAAALKQDIIRRYPNTRYAQILENPQAVPEETTNGAGAKYTALYKAYEEQRFSEVIAQCERYSNTFAGDPMVPKFALLRAQAIGRLQGLASFKKALNDVALTYPNHPEGKKAVHMLTEQLPRWENEQFSKETGSSGSGNWKIVFPFATADDKKAVAFKKRLEAILEELGYTHGVSKDIYTAEQEFVVIHGFSSKNFARGFVALLKNNKDYPGTYENFVILSHNYKIVQMHKNLAVYTAALLTEKF